MPRQRVVFKKQYPQPPDQVFPLFADHHRFGKLLGAPIKRIKDAPAGTDPNGVGSVRRIAGGPFAFEETVLTAEPLELIEYTVSRGGPIKNHLGRIEFRPTKNGGTALHYTIEFDGRIPGSGKVIAGVLRTLIGRALDRVPNQTAAAR